MAQLKLNVIGDSGPFSRLGKSIGYQLKHQDSNFLVDCGAPVFQLLGSDGLTELDGIIGTHAHEDHKRWFTDIALYQKFSANSEQRVKLFGSYEILRDYRRASGPALERTLTDDSRDVLNLRFEDYVQPIQIGPTPKYRCEKIPTGDGTFQWRVMNGNDEVLPPERAKVVRPEASSVPRMLFKDPEDDIWVDPGTFYAYDDDRFYENGENPEHSLADDLIVTPLKAPAWHGPPTNSLLFKTKTSNLFFSSDTVYDPELWTDLTRRRPPEEPLDTADYLDRHFLESEARRHVAQTWSQRRLEKALAVYDRDYIYVHDVSGPDSKVHTSYDNLENFKGKILLTHSPDEFNSLHPLAHLGKSYVIENNSVREVTRTGETYPLEADCYLKRYSEYLVGFQADEGSHFLVKLDEGVYEIVEDKELLDPDTEVIMQVDLYKAIGGEYYPVSDREDQEYFIRPDGRVELQKHHEDGTEGTIVEGHRSRLTKD